MEREEKIVILKLTKKICMGLWGTIPFLVRRWNLNMNFFFREKEPLWGAGSGNYKEKNFHHIYMSQIPHAQTSLTSLSYHSTLPVVCVFECRSLLPFTHPQGELLLSRQMWRRRFSNPSSLHPMHSKHENFRRNSSPSFTKCLYSYLKLWNEEREGGGDNGTKRESADSCAQKGFAFNYGCIHNTCQALLDQQRQKNVTSVRCTISCCSLILFFFFFFSSKFYFISCT